MSSERVIHHLGGRKTKESAGLHEITEPRYGACITNVVVVGLGNVKNDLQSRLESLFVYDSEGPELTIHQRIHFLLVGFKKELEIGPSTPSGAKAIP